LQNYTTTSKFYSFDNPLWAMVVQQSPWPTTIADSGCNILTAAGSRLATAMAHGGCTWPTTVGHGG
jgi:hypothetical protein